MVRVGSVVNVAIVSAIGSIEQPISVDLPLLTRIIRLEKQLGRATIDLEIRRDSTKPLSISKGLYLLRCRSEHARPYLNSRVFKHS